MVLDPSIEAFFTMYTFPIFHKRIQTSIYSIIHFYLLNILLNTNLIIGPAISNCNGNATIKFIPSALI